MTLTVWLEIAASAIGAILASRTLLHYYQLESYQLPGFLRSIKRNGVSVWIPGWTLFLGHVAAWLLTASFGNGVWQGITSCVLIVACAYISNLEQKKVKAKKPFVITARIKRLYGVAFILSVCLRLLFVWVTSSSLLITVRIILTCVWLAFPVMLPLFIMTAGLAALPMEKGIQLMYFRDAQRILRSRPDLIKIGITGSYGKTSVKFILGTLLSEKYQTLVSPASFNTPMGLTKVIRNNLTPAHQVFVAEMGARHVGDIRELCRLVHPEMGLLVSVGPQHLETFGSIERIRDTKYELMEAIPQEGCCFFLNDEGIVRELYEKTAKPKFLVSVFKGCGDVWAEDIRVSPEGSSFILCTSSQKIPCTTKLLGEHNIGNILLASAVCLHLGMTEKQISRGISQLHPVEHRLQLIPTPGGITMIDDAFNSNPNGAKAALHVLREFPERRLIVTPGMVELGSEEDRYNFEFGSEMAECVDIAILVGRKRTQAIQAGLKEKGFPEENMHVVQSLEEATNLMRTLTRRGDTVLFENDLPDNYSE